MGLIKPKSNTVQNSNAKITIATTSAQYPAILQYYNRNTNLHAKKIIANNQTVTLPMAVGDIVTIYYYSDYVTITIPEQAEAVTLQNDEIIDLTDASVSKVMKFIHITRTA